MNIKKKLIAIALVSAMAVSFSACSDKKDGSSSAGVATGATLSSEEIQALEKHELTISPFDESSENAQDPVENSNTDSEGSGNTSSASQGGNTNSSSDSQSGNNSSADDSNDNTSATLSEEDLLNPTDVVMIPGQNPDDSSSDDNNNTTTSGNKEIMQAWWMDLTQRSDFVFDGEFITAQFKIKETTANGTYPITIEWTDFSNWNAQSVKFNTTDGAVVVGSEATENSFKNDGSAEIMATNVSGNPGDTVTVTFNMKNNPGIVACVFRFGYDSDALEYVGGGSGKDFSGTFS